MGPDSRAVEMIGADLLCHANPHIRSAAFSFVINASPLKEPLTKTTLNSLRFALPSYHAEVDPNLRQDNVAMIKKMILRLTTTLRASKSTATTSVAKRPLAEQARRGAPAASEFDFGSQIYGEHRLFFAWYLGFLTQELGPTASYQRHLVSLRVLGFLFSKSPYARQLFIEYKFNDSEGRDCCFVSEAELTTSLHELLLDPFEDVRELAASFLESSRESPWTVKTMLSSERPTFLVTQPTDVEEAPLWLDEALRTRTLHRAVAKMQSTGRADHADGFGRLYDILNGRHGKSAGGRPSNDEPHFVLRDIISILGHCAAIAQTDIYLAVKTASLHGYLIAAR